MVFSDGSIRVFGKIRITGVGNAGLYLEDETEGILIDCPYDSEGLPFSDMAEGLMDELCDPEGRFDKLSRIIFTHEHPDHFSAKKLLVLLTSGKIKTVFMPQRGAEAFRSLALPADHGSEIFVLSGQTSAEFGNWSVSFIPTVHLDKQYADVVNYCCLISNGDFYAAVTSDADYVNEKMPWLIGEEPDLIFVNPLMFHEIRRGSVQINRSKLPEIAVYHVPPDSKEMTGLLNMLKADISKWEMQEMKG